MVSRNPNHMRVKQAAAISGVHEETIRRWYRKGAIRHWTNGGGRTVLVDVTECVSREPREADARTCIAQSGSM